MIDVELLEGLSAVTSHEQEALPLSGLGELGVKFPHFSCEDEGAVRGDVGELELDGRGRRTSK